MSNEDAVCECESEWTYWFGKKTQKWNEQAFFSLKWIMPKCVINWKKCRPILKKKIAQDNDKVFARLCKQCANSDYDKKQDLNEDRMKGMLQVTQEVHTETVKMLLKKNVSC